MVLTPNYAVSLLLAMLSSLDLTSAASYCSTNVNDTVAIVSVYDKALGPDTGDRFNCTCLPGAFTGDESVSLAANYVSYLRINDNADCEYDSWTANCTVQTNEDSSNGSPNKTKAEMDVASFCTQLLGTYSNALS